MLKVGIVGIGFMGMMHYLAYQRVKGIKVAAVCSRDAKKRSGDWRGIQGNFGPAGTQMDLQGVRGYADLGELLADSTIDVVDICLPPSQHAPATIAALKADKHVFCEKPIAISESDAKKMTAAAAASGKQLFVGHVLPFFPEYAYALKQIQTGKFGQLLGGHFKRMISIPTWGNDYFNPVLAGGPLIDLHVHDAHFIRVLFGMPVAVQTVGRLRGEVAEYASTQFVYADHKYAVSAMSGVIRQQGRSFTHGYEIHCEKATLMFELAVLEGQAHVAMPLTVLDAKGKATRPELGSGDDIAGFEAEIKEYVQCIKRGEPSTLLDGGLARDALVLCHKQLKSLVNGRSVKI